MNSDFRKTGNSKNGAVNSSQSSSFQDVPEETIKQIKDKIEKKLGPDLKEKIESGIEKEVGEKGANEILPARESRGEQTDRIREEAKSEAEKNKYTKSDPLSKNLRRPEESRNSSIDSEKSRNLSIDSKRQKKIDKHTEEAKREAQKEIKKASKQVKSVKAKIALRIAGDHFDKIALAIAQKMSKEANRGGLHSVMPIAITYFIAIGKDILDVFINLLDLTGIGVVVVIVVTAIIGGIFAIILAVFWISIGGEWKGGILKKKFLKMILKRYGLRIVVVVIIGDSVAVFNILPLMLIFNIWAHFDFVKDVRKSKVKFKSFMEEYASKKRINKSIAKRYISKIQQE
ncbi:MAG: hypothetical protein KAQ64_02770 [Candidatus Pacebacteria bacterium]|nr:hypothetical protein [Candidatus Paceibacterota bacterium]